MVIVSNSKKDQAQAKALPVFSKPARSHLAALDVFLHEQVAEFEEEVREMVNYCLVHAGKRLRPILCFYSGWREGEVDSRLVQAAAVVELVHLATLVHDDILDDAAIRHSSSTAKARYGTPVAVLLGDALFAHALKLASQYDTVEVCAAVSEATRKVCSGEIMQTLNRGNPAISYEQYIRVIDFKTAELFRVSCLLGARLSGASDDYVQAAATFGRQLGISYQIYDDLIDYLGKEEKTGKTLGTDLESGKYTLPVMLLVDSLAGRDKSTLISRIADEKGSIITELNDRMHSTGIFRQSRDVLLAELTKGENALAPYAEEAGTAHLLRLSGYLKEQINKLAV